MLKNEPRLSKRQLDAWTTFGPLWDDFKEAWLARGFLFPPDGTPEDDYGVSLRSRLWAMVDARPTDVAYWIREAPGHSRYEVISYLFRQWSDIQESVPSDEEEWNPEQRAKWREREQAPQSLRTILRNLAT